MERARSHYRFLLLWNRFAIIACIVVFGLDLYFHGYVQAIATIGCLIVCVYSLQVSLKKLAATIHTWEELIDKIDASITKLEALIATGAHLEVILDTWISMN